MTASTRTPVHTETIAVTVPEPVGFWLDGVFHTDCPYCGAPMGTVECCGLSTDEAYNARMVGSAGGDVFMGPAGATLVEPERPRRLPHALKGGAR